MLYSALVGFIAYHVICFVIAFLANAMTLEGHILALALVGYIGAYYAHSFSRFVYRMAMWTGTVGAILWLAIKVLLPLLAGSTSKWSFSLAILGGLMMYFATRPRVFRHYTRRNHDGALTAPPFGREWCRWLAIITM